MEIPHSSKVVTGRRVPFLHRPDWRGSDGFWIAVAPLLIFGAVGWWLLQFHEGYRFDGVMARATGLGLVAVAFGVGTLYLSFWGDRTVTAPCPCCGESQEWGPGTHSSRCVKCLAHMRVDKDGSIREMPLEDMGGYSLDTIDLEAVIARDGHVTVTMPAICATCGAEPTTTAKVKDDTVVAERAKGAGAVTANELAALGVPLCAQHADQAPISIDSYVVSLRMDSYRYYRGFLIVNGLPKHAVQRVTAARSPAPRPQVTPGQLEPLVCPSCGAPLPVSEADETTCTSCGHTAALPEPYKQLRDAKRMSDEDAAELHALAADIAKPPPAWKRVSMIVGYAVGGATVVVMAIGAIIGGIAGVVAGSQLGETAAKALAIVGAVALGVVSIPFAGEWLAALATLHHTDAATAIAAGASPAYHYDLIAAAILYGLGVLPFALAIRTQGNLDGITKLQGKLAAHPSPQACGGMCCRHCGAALDVARDAIVSRCLYCGADNLLTVPAEIAATHEHEAKDLDAKVHDAVAQHARERDDDRSLTLGLLIIGVLVVPYLCAAGYLLHRFLA